MASTKEQKYLDKIMGKGAPAVASLPQEDNEPKVDKRLGILMQAINCLGLGVVVSEDDEGTLYIGKATPQGNHYIIINSEEPGGAYAFANQAENQGEVHESDNIREVATMFKEKIDEQLTQQ